MSRGFGGEGHTLFDLELDLHHVVDDLAAGDALHDQQGVGVDPVKLPEAAQSGDAGLLFIFVGECQNCSKAGRRFEGGSLHTGLVRLVAST